MNKKEELVNVAGKTKNEVLREVTDRYIADLDLSNPPDPYTIERELLHTVKVEFDIENSTRDKFDKWKVPQTLTFAQIAVLMQALYPICRISCAGDRTNTEFDLLAVYETDGPNKGIYVTSEERFRQLARQFNYSLTSKDFSEIMTNLKDTAPRKARCTDRDLVAVNNGIFNYETKELYPFSPDYVFLSKSHVNYNPAATNIVIHNDDDGTDWDVESWMASLSDDPEIVEVLWEILSAIIRPNVRWNKSAWLYSEQGNNGKGTLCELMRELCGSDAYACIPISDFSKDFLLEPLTRASAIIVDENDVGSYVDKAANLKAVITNDVIMINRKFKSPIAYQFYGFMVQCLNEMPRFKDKSDSFYRRQLFIPMTKCFTGRERKYIKNDYLHRKDVLEYVLYKVLNTNFYTLSEPEACRAVLDEYKEFNDPVRQFFEEISPTLQWDLVPFTFLYELYRAWYQRNAPSGVLQGRNTFINDLLNIIKDSNTWYCRGKTVSIKSANRMNKPEHLIMEYNLAGWKNPTCRSSDIDKICTPMLASTYRGIERYTLAPSPDDGEPPSKNECNGENNQQDETGSKDSANDGI